MTTATALSAGTQVATVRSFTLLPRSVRLWTLAWRGVATDGNAANATTGFTAVLGDLEGVVDWPLMHARHWNSTEDDPDRQRRRMAEFLVISYLGAG